MRLSTLCANSTALRNSTIIKNRFEESNIKKANAKIHGRPEKNVSESVRQSRNTYKSRKIKQEQQNPNTKC